MFEQTFKNIDDILHKDAGCGSELDYVEQTSWVLFLKYLDDLEREKATSAALTLKSYTPIIAPEYQWNTWAAPKDAEGKLDHHTALGGDDLKDFVDHKLFPYLKKFKVDAESADTIEYKIGEIFSELKNRVQSGYNLREVINRIDELRFRTHAEKHEMSHLYEDKIKNMGNAGRNGGEYYTPRPLIKTIVRVVAPEIGQKIYDGAVGSAGFLVEAFEYLKHSKKLTTSDTLTLQKTTFYGKEKKSLAYIIGTMNMILHGIEAPNIVHANTLAINLDDIQDKDRYDVVLANPPFGGKERAEVQQNFPIKTGETASLFLQHFIKILKAGGRAGVVIKNTFLSNTDNASIALRKKLLEECNLHSVLDLPGGTFTGAGVKTVVLFFEKGAPTRKVWFYQLNLDRNLGKTNALNEKDLAEFVELQKTFGESENSWSIDVRHIDQSTFDLSAKNPNKKEEAALRKPQEILEEMKVLDEESAEILGKISKNNLQSVFSTKGEGWEEKKLGEVCEMINRGISPKYSENNGIIVLNQKCIRDHEISFEKSRFHDGIVKKVSPEKMVKLGDVLINSTGTGTLGRVAQVREKLENVTVDSHVTIVRPIPDLFYIDFFGWALIFIEEEIAKRGEGCGGQTELARNTLKNDFTICYPISLTEQQKIVQKLDALSAETKRLEAIYQQKIDNLEELKKSILQKAFNGEL